MKCQSIILQVILGVSFAVLLGCSSAVQTVGQAVVPDYHTNREIKKAFPPDVIITIPCYPMTCANAKTPDGNWYRTITIYVYLRYQDPASVSILINDNVEIGLMETGVSDSHTFRYPAGAGKHNLEIWVNSDPPQYFERTISVAVCGQKSKTIRSYKS